MNMTVADLYCNVPVLASGFAYSPSSISQDLTQNVFLLNEAACFQARVEESPQVRNE
jgi:hypothetical protein